MKKYDRGRVVRCWPIEADPVPGQGYVFAFEIPVTPVSIEPSEADVAPVVASPFQHLRILLAEDHPVNRRVVGFMLEPMGVELTAVENGALAVTAAAAGAFDLILMDMQMPVMDGLEAVRRIREREAAQASAAVPICMLTANTLPEARDMALAAGADGFLTKPIDAQALVRQIMTLVLRSDLSADWARCPESGLGRLTSPEGDFHETGGRKVTANAILV